MTFLRTGSNFANTKQKIGGLRKPLEADQLSSNEFLFCRKLSKMLWKTLNAQKGIRFLVKFETGKCFSTVQRINMKIYHCGVYWY